MKVPRNVLQLARIILLRCLKQIQYKKYMYYINTNVLALNIASKRMAHCAKIHNYYLIKLPLTLATAGLPKQAA